MVKKLFKHELLAYSRVALPVWGILLGIAVLGRLIQLFEANNVTYDIIFISSAVMYGIAVAACLAFPLVFGIQRFHKNLFTGEGYLSFTLPVTPFQHIWVKLWSAVLLMVATLVVVVLSVGVITVGDVLVELCKAMGYLLGQMFTVYEPIHLVFYAMECALLLVASFGSSYLLFYACIAIGQTFKKNRVLGAVGIYFLYYLICQVLGTIFILILNNLSPEFLREVFAFTDEHPYATVHLLLCGLLVWTLLWSGVYFLVTHGIIRKKLNLE